jgi:hypothetical protein
LPHRLFFRRFHKDSGSWKRGDAAHDARVYHASGAGRATFTKWRSHLRYFSAVSSSPLPLRSRALLYRHLTRRMIWDRHDLARELAHYAGLSSR